jgi:hypothetical protein
METRSARGPRRLYAGRSPVAARRAISASRSRIAFAIVRGRSITPRPRNEGVVTNPGHRPLTSTMRACWTPKPASRSAALNSAAVRTGGGCGSFISQCPIDLVRPMPDRAPSSRMLPSVIGSIGRSKRRICQLRRSGHSLVSRCRRRRLTSCLASRSKRTTGRKSNATASSVASLISRSSSARTCACHAPQSWGFSERSSDSR